jgi:uncharacterized C2H2 Zn-finger protein
MDNFTCPYCDSIIIKCNVDYIKILNKTIIFRNNSCFSVCKGCNKEISIPLTIDKTSLKRAHQPKLVVNISNKNSS